MGGFPRRSAPTEIKGNAIWQPLMGDQQSIRVIDLFAGPGGLSEGFSSFETDGGHRPFRIGLSVEMEKDAHQTLKLRSFFRQFEKGHAPDKYYELLRRCDEPLSKRLQELFGAYPDEARNAIQEAWQAELGKEDPHLVHDKVAAALGNVDPWVLLGGPPCQAYSIAGRSRNKGNPDYKPDEDKRLRLYVEYLQVIADHRPAAFVMENVKGLLSATVLEQKIFKRIVDDLKNPCAALLRENRCIQSRTDKPDPPEYQVFSLVRPTAPENGDLRDFAVHMERYGVPQARHRLILLGVRKDILGSRRPSSLDSHDAVAAKDVLECLPRLRAGLSKETDSPEAWRAWLRAAKERRWFAATLNKAGETTYDQLVSTVETLASPRNDRGAEFVHWEPEIRYEPAWFIDERIGGVYNHSTRAHIARDLYRYLYVACFGKAQDRSPVLADFPADLLPDHRNVESALKGGTFEDRFRVQLASRPSTTITCHIAKDGHYYIHYDPSQCRSLTVREAARLQTFPDNYFFCGPRTEQYTQVGNAVPPLLARQVAKIVWDVLRESGAANR